MNQLSFLLSPYFTIDLEINDSLTLHDCNAPFVFILFVETKEFDDDDNGSLFENFFLIYS